MICPLLDLTGMLVLAYLAHPQVKAYIGRSRLSTLVMTQYPTTKKGFGECIFLEMTLGDVFLPPTCRRDDHHLG